ncbi:substrate-binding domain-containing protein [Litorimonas sp. RW-G-Af-16]|uniref:substrate-binding domain-containing protein n=1 Tax=Litorimonas sp. RW-G-Af-16 TaxID=3241168 RepID=UPI00390C4143
MRKNLCLLGSFCFALAGCVDQSSSGANDSSLSAERILSTFQTELDAPSDNNAAADKADHSQLSPPDDWLPLIDPLDLPNGVITIAGSDTLSPVTIDLADSFYDDGYVGMFSISQSSTGTGMRAMCRGEGVDIVNASRPISASERALCAQNGIKPIMFKVGYDPFVLLTHPSNTWLKSVRRAELPALFKAENWSEFNQAAPNVPIQFHVPSQDSGAMRAMLEYVFGTVNVDYDTVFKGAEFYSFNLELTRDLAKDPHALGFASYGKILQLKQLKTNIIPIDGYSPVESGAAYPVKRSLYLYTHQAAFEKPEVQSFVAYYYNNTYRVMPELGFAPIEGAEAASRRRAYQALTPPVD